MKNQQKPPKDLTLEGKRLYAQICEQYAIADPTGLHYLSTGCRHFDLMRRAQKILKCDGPTMTDRFGAVHQHPAAAVARDASASMLRAFRALNLDIGKAAPLGRPELMKLRGIK